MDCANPCRWTQRYRRPRAYWLGLGYHHTVYTPTEAACLCAHFRRTSAIQRERCGNKSDTTVYLHVITLNLAAIQFYSKLQFECVRCLHEFYTIHGERKPTPGQERYDALLFIYYVNGGHPPFTLLRALANLLAACRPVTGDHSAGGIDETSPSTSRQVINEE
eukprot:8731785-Pyramimonas_sp.AAC.1